MAMNKFVVLPAMVKVILVSTLARAWVQASPYFVQKPNDIVVASGQTGTFNCIVGNFISEGYKVGWYSHREERTRQWTSTTERWDNATRTFYSTLSFSGVTEEDIGYYFCEVRSVTPGAILDYAAASLTLTAVQERLQCGKSTGTGSIVRLYKPGDTVSMNCTMARDTYTEQYWSVLHGSKGIEDFDYRLSCVGCTGNSKYIKTKQKMSSFSKRYSILTFVLVITDITNHFHPFTIIRALYMILFTVG